MQKRAVLLFSLICAMLGALLLRTAQLGRSLSAEALQSTHMRTLTVGRSRGLIYDCALRQLVDCKEALLAAVAPSAAALGALEPVFGAEKTDAMLRAGVPCLQKMGSAVQNEFMRTFAVPVRTDENTLAPHLIGRVNAAGKGESGIEKAFDGFLTKNGGSMRVRFETDAAGRSLPGMKKEILDQNFRSRAGVVLTIDREVQTLTEQILRGSAIQSGCVLVMESETGAIRAMANVPNADENKDPALSPYRNKALSAYSVGSVFKPLLAAFALESGIPASFCCTCEGQCRIGDTVFRCYAGRAHGAETMKEALENSCNIYFIRLMQEIDATAFLSFCRSLGLGQTLSICGGLASAKGILPEATGMLPGEQANFSFGQGRLLLSPLHLLAIYQMLATGRLVEPNIHLGFLDAKGRFTREPAQSGRQILSERTVQTLRSLLQSAAENMNQSRAKSERLALAGKTGTAQSGIYRNGREICRTWFCGFAPARTPKWIVVILNEDGVSGNADCAPVFRAICEGLFNASPDSSSGMPPF